MYLKNRRGFPGRHRRVPEGEQRRLEAPILYECYDATYVAMTPARWSAATAKLLFGNPFSPLAFTLTGRMLSASADVFSGVTRRRGKPAWDLPATVEVIDDRPFGQLVRFATERVREAPRVLIVAPLSGHYATMVRPTIETLLDEHDVYVTDWTDARDVSAALGRFDLDDYIAYVMEYLRSLGPDLHVIAVCQPAPAVMAAVALVAADDDAAQPRSMTLMGGPVDVSAAETAPTKLAASRSLRWFEQTLTTTIPGWYRGAGRRVYPGFLQLGAFMAMNPDRHVEAHAKLFQDIVLGDEESAHSRRAFYDEYFSVMDIPAEFYLQTIDVVFQQAALAQGTMTWRGQPVELDAIRSTALMTIEGERDDISAPGQTYAAHALCRSIPAARRAHYLQEGAGHYGIFSGRRWQNEIAPRIAAFIRDAR